jgi:hypothetical protein
MIIRNAAECLKCGDVIQSTYRHDYQECACGDIFVDGGHSYLRYGAKEGGSLKDLSITTDKPFRPTPVQLEHSDTVINAHHPDDCAGPACALHRRTDHSKRSWKQSIDMYGDVFVITRICPHDNEYRDPDDLLLIEYQKCFRCEAGDK